MIDALKKIFPSLLVHKDYLMELPEDHRWFLTGSDQVIGIHNNELNSENEAILSALLTPYNVKLPPLTDQEKRWKALISSPPEQDGEVPGYRFVYFTLKKNQIEPEAFVSAIQDLFQAPVPFLWQNDHEGIIIELKDSTSDENISYEQIIDTLMSDLYVKINFFVGPFLYSYVNIDKHYAAMGETARVVFSCSDEPVITYVDAIPISLVSLTSEELRSQMREHILMEFKDDDEFLATIHTFIESNMNISVAAKNLYMHRNSLQYRLDKFYDRTGIDVRQFDQAVTVYLALLANMHKE